jgi:hypothetical protein
LLAKAVLATASNDGSDDHDFKGIVYGIGDDSSADEDESAQDRALAVQKGSQLRRSPHVTTVPATVPDTAYADQNQVYKRWAADKNTSTNNLTDSNYGVRLKTEEVVFSDTGDSFVQPDETFFSSPPISQKVQRNSAAAPMPVHGNGPDYVCEYTYHNGEEVMLSPVGHSDSAPQYQCTNPFAFCPVDGSKNEIPGETYGGVEISSKITTNAPSHYPSMAQPGTLAADNTSDEMWDRTRMHEDIRYLRVLLEVRFSCKN